MTGEDSKLTHIIWVNENAKEDYECFGDVVVFDTAYNKNKYSMISVPFYGVSHHRE